MNKCVCSEKRLALKITQKNNPLYKYLWKFLENHNLFLFLYQTVHFAE